MYYERESLVANECYLAFLFFERAGFKFEELHIDLKKDWHKKISNYPRTVDDAYDLLETFCSTNKFIKNIVEKSKQNDRSNNTNNSNLKTNSGLSFN